MFLCVIYTTLTIKMVDDAIIAVSMKNGKKVYRYLTPSKLD